MNSKDGSVKVVVTAIVVNFFVTLAKSIGWVFSPNPSMLAEAIHSFADTANQSLVYLGITISKKAATREFPTGYGQARYLWNLISASGIFFIGFGVTVYHGVTALISPHHDELVSYGLGIGILIFALPPPIVGTSKAVPRAASVIDIGNSKKRFSSDLLKIL